MSVIKVGQGHVVVFSVMNNYQAAAAAAAQGFGPPASPHATNTRAGFPPANSPGPTIDMYSSSAADSVAGYVQAASPQPSGFPAIAVSRAPINYNPVSLSSFFFSFFFCCKAFEGNYLQMLVPVTISNISVCQLISKIKWMLHLIASKDFI